MFNWGGNTNFHAMNLDWLIQFAKDAQETINNALAAIQAAIAQISGKQDLLVSGQNIKTINGESVLGAGNLEISGGSGDVSSVNGMTGTVVLKASDIDTNVAGINVQNALGSLNTEIGSLDNRLIAVEDELLGVNALVGEGF